ncbi:SNF2 helicase associated domain-containing protein [Paenibacillus sp. GSMTC-2017]|uniref:DEAD/DEAH box helicase n=1 Tax=Paenibacillus sp. GSMTC-2017 TaxID=2794350 RepID=UPI0018D93FAD|nr:DEAD/DEAH box helicase [Paenibacillus sp. GSMTC-2017]MBH5319059.1 SNF2 helicase associated domain-containing protein [Paenibacillus sp. GSMTC-2017]
MGYQITERIIKLLCGPDNFERGEAYFRDGKVTCKRIGDDDQEHYSAIIASNKNYDVKIEVDSNNDVDAECSCLAFYTDNNYCKHVAAALLYIHNQQYGHNQKPTKSYSFDLGTELQDNISNGQIVDDMLNLFYEKPKRPIGTGVLQDTRELLQVEFSCQLVPYGYRKHKIGIELKLGTERLYIVQKIIDVLDHIRLGKEFSFSKLFAYDPALHRFSPEDDTIIKKLLMICSQEQSYKETMLRSVVDSARSANNERLLLIPPFAWEELLPYLQHAPNVNIVLNELRNRRNIAQRFEGLQLTEEKLPLRFSIDQDHSGNGYVLIAHGIHELIVIDAYGMAFREGKLYRVTDRMLQQFSKLKHLFAGELGVSDRTSLYISPNQIEPFMERVIPGLMKLGIVEISESISEQVLYRPLKARMYLDRVRDRLLAGLEFQYGDIVINPLEAVDKHRGTDRILMRDGERERQILAMLEHESYGKTEGGYIIESDDAEYEFLHQLVPELEQLLDIYATSAVKLRLVTEHAPPKMSITWDERTDWLEFKFELDGIPDKEIKKLIQAIDEKRQYYKLPNGALMPLDTAAFQAVIRVMNGVGLHHLALHDDSIRLPAFRALSLIDMPLQNSSVKLSKSLRELLDNMRNPENLDFPIPESLAPVLRDYQKHGYQWMKTVAYYRFGGILADDMGLGKTIQSIAFLLSVLPSIREQGIPALIVAPSSLMYNWRNELTKFAPQIKAVIADGVKGERGEVLAGLSGVTPDVIITSYPLLRKDAVAYTTQSFHTLILDEAQAFKNYTTQTAQIVRSLNAQYRFALTGTPIENRLEELWSIFSAVFPELFQDRKTFGELTRETIARRSRPFLLRRLKSDVLKELPEKIETLQPSELLDDQKKLYAAYLAKLQEDSLKHLDSGDFGKERIKILAGITRLRQLCCHPSLFIEDYKGSSAKFEQLFELIEECRSTGRRMLIFSQFTEMLGLIGRELGYQGVPYFYLDGSTPASERVELCNRFNDGERELFLLSLKAGGTGLNLTGADTVILYDLWWNPAVEQQAADRAHRIGQRKVVQVIRLVAQGTVEDKMYALQERKKNLIDEIIQPGSESLSTLTEQDLREILSLNEASS